MSLNFAAAVDNEHHLLHSWNWRYSIEVKDKDESQVPGKDKEKVQLATVSTVESFWCLFNNIALPSTYKLDGTYTESMGKDLMNVRVTYYMFKNGVDPTWEHPLNADGGFWQLYAPNPNINEMWTKVVLALIGESLEDNDNDNINNGDSGNTTKGQTRSTSHQMGLNEVICGAEINCVSNRIRIWTRLSEDAEKQMKIGKRLRENLQLHSSDNVFYFKHGVRPRKENVKYNCPHNSLRGI